MTPTPPSPTPRGPRPVSVVVPAHRAADTIEACLEALLRALPPGSEIVVVDDGSADATAERASAVSPGNVAVSVVRLPENRGAAAARNVGVARATHDPILFIDADVIVPDDLVARIESAFGADAPGEDAPDAVIGMFGPSMIHTDFASQYKLHLHRSYHRRLPRRTVKTLITAICAVRRHALDAVGGFDESIAGAANEDVELGARLVEAGFTIHFDPAMEVEHRKRYTLPSLVGTQWSRAHAMGRLFFRRAGVRETVRTGVFLSIPLSFGASLVLGPAVVALVALAVVAAVAGVAGVMGFGGIEVPGISGPVPVEVVGGALALLALLLYAAMISTHVRFLADMARRSGPRSLLLALGFLPLDFTLGALGAGAGWLGGFAGAIGSRSATPDSTLDATLDAATDARPAPSEIVR